DKADPNVAHDVVTVIDHALTRPWTVMKNLRRNPNPYPAWNEENCPETNPHVTVGKEDYMVSGDGYLMPTKKGQKPPDLRYFKYGQRGEDGDRIVAIAILMQLCWREGVDAAFLLAVAKEHPPAHRSVCAAVEPLSCSGSSCREELR